MAKLKFFVPAILFAALLGFFPTVATGELFNYLFEIGSGLSILILPPTVLAYFGVLHRRSRQHEAARYCIGAAVFLGLVNASVAYEYLGEALLFRHLPAPVHFAAISPFHRYMIGLPLPIMSMYHVAGDYHEWPFIPVLAYVFAAYAFRRTHQIASTQIRERATAAGPDERTG